MLLGLCFSFFNALAQDIHNSQFYASPLTLNPALTGNINTACRAGAILRDQWRSQAVNPITTINLSYEQKYENAGGSFGYGGVAIQDEWITEVFFNSRFYLSGAYHKRMGNHQLSFGLQPGFIYRSFKEPEYTYPEQYDRFIGDFNPNASGGENASIANPTLFKFDMNAGLEWIGNFSLVDFHAGISSFHVTKPDQAIYSSNPQRLNRLWVITTGASYALNDEWTIFPNVIYMQQGRSEKLHFGGGIEKSLESDFSFINVSTYVRSSGAIIFITGVGYKNLDFAFSYDAGTNRDLGAFAIDKAFEFSVIYKCSFDASLPDVYVPCNRY